MSNIDIDYTLIQQTNCVSMRIETLSLILFTSCLFLVTFFDANGNAVKSQQLLMEGDAYLSWGGDDQYAVTWIKQQLNIN